MTKEVDSGFKFQYFGIWISIGWIIVAVIIYLSLTANPPVIFEFSSADKLKHLLAYGILIAWFSQLFTVKQQQFILIVLFCLLGVVLEFAQGWGSYRYFDVVDMAANALGVLLGWWLSNSLLAGSLLRADYTLFKCLK